MPSSTRMRGREDSGSHMMAMTSSTLGGSASGSSNLFSASNSIGGSRTTSPLLPSRVGPSPRARRTTPQSTPRGRRGSSNNHDEQQQPLYQEPYFSSGRQPMMGTTAPSKSPPSSPSSSAATLPSADAGLAVAAVRGASREGGGAPSLQLVRKGKESQFTDPVMMVRDQISPLHSNDAIKVYKLLRYAKKSFCRHYCATFLFRSIRPLPILHF